MAATQLPFNKKVLLNGKEGNEAAGISDAILELAHEHITIPRWGQAESLNAAVATGLILYEARRKD
ncbi:MAG: hypothetical protein EOO10_15645 [Chitinophagaceae bacterium]|nr:MAG: hypothetical protein EOO10_15645 [Chitinophagaceae bacterium]